MLIIILLFVSLLSLTLNFNNVIRLLNFITVIAIINFLLIINSYINLTLFILLVYSSLIVMIFLVTGLLLMNSTVKPSNSSYFSFLSKNK